MALEFRMSLPASMFLGDNQEIITGDNPATPANIVGRAAMQFTNDGTDQEAMVSQSVSIPDANIWTDGSGVALRVHYFGATAGGGFGVTLSAGWECIAEGEAPNMATASSFDTGDEQAVDDDVDTSAGYLNIVDILFTQAQADGIVAGDAARLYVRRDSAAANDDYADSIYITHIDILEDV